MTVQDTLAEREKQYGKFTDIARLSGDLQRVMRTGRNWDALPDDMREALQTIASKIARVLNGDCEHIDSWHDIAGYAVLIENRLRQTPELAPAPELANPPPGFDCWYSTSQGATCPWFAKNIKTGKTARAETRDRALAAVQEPG